MKNNLLGVNMEKAFDVSNFILSFSFSFFYCITLD